MIPIVEMLRRETSKKWGTIGVISINKEIAGFTLEPPDEENKPNISSIPAGQYICKKRDSPAHGITFTVQDVTDRTFINFHPVWIDDDTEGCIGIGSSVVKLKSGDRAMVNSGKTFASFMEKLQKVDEFHLTITEVY